ncbi:hypothetical protein [Paenibacillus albidus]|uniref:hypothetical protein n=1 Tax=Paenibacillus albidus TaxID=2041023 RepID=UPI001E524C21|nr:hypothetical protein [Paenibacillus albidus]
MIPTHAEIARRVGVSQVTVHNTVRDYCTRGIQETLRYRDRTEPARPSQVTGEVEAPSSLWPAPNLLKAMPAGRCVC